MHSLGVDRETGVRLTDWDHVRQSVEDIVRTRIGSRVLARDYGSEIPDLIDAPMNPSNVLSLLVGLGDALAAHEPRFQIASADVEAAGADGRAQIRIVGTFYPFGHRGDFSRGAEQTWLVRA